MPTPAGEVLSRVIGRGCLPPLSASPAQGATLRVFGRLLWLFRGAPLRPSGAEGRSGTSLGGAKTPSVCRRRVWLGRCPLGGGGVLVRSARALGRGARGGASSDPRSPAPGEREEAPENAPCVRAPPPELAGRRRRRRCRRCRRCRRRRRGRARLQCLSPRSDRDDDLFGRVPPGVRPEERGRERRRTESPRGPLAHRAPVPGDTSGALSRPGGPTTHARQRASSITSP